jgi:SAM-dependent methyltransferase
MADEQCLDVMRADWNRRAREDANYFVAFGRREQDDAEFFATAADVVRLLEGELKRLPAGGDRRARRALEIGCGPGRLMRPMSRHFGEIHGVDVSDEMIRLAEMRLEGIPHAHVHATSGSDLAIFADETFDFAYSYAVFQHIPSRDVVFQYLLEARRVLKTGGLLRCQINGLPAAARQYDTWSGVRISAREIADFARDHDFQLLALEGVSTQYMWTTLRKQPAGWGERIERRIAADQVRIRRITNSYNSEPVIPCRGRFAFATLWLEGLAPDCDLNNLQVAFDGVKGDASYLGPPEMDGLQQVNAILPPVIRTGLVPLRVFWSGQPASAPAFVRIIPPGPAVPRVISVTDGVDLLSGPCIASGCVKVTLEEIPSAEDFHVALDGHPVNDLDSFCTDPLPPRFEVNLRIPETAEPGAHLLEMSYGARRFAPVSVEVVPPR